MHKFFLALVLLSVPVSTGALAHSGSEQEQQACTRDVQRFCRKLMDHYHSGLPQGKSPEALSRVPRCVGQPWAIANDRSIEDRSRPDPNAEKPAS
jgi:hypothetical protein